MKKKQDRQTFNDGLVSIYAVGNTAEPGMQPKDGLTVKVGPLRFDERKVGITRFYTSKQAGSQIERVVRVPAFRSVRAEDVVLFISELDPEKPEETNDVQYEIDQVQFPDDVYPPVMDLALKRPEVKYVIA